MIEESNLTNTYILKYTIEVTTQVSVVRCQESESCANINYFNTLDKLVKYYEIYWSSL